jgi:hypothetical protein
MERGGCALDSNVDEPEVVIGERAIVVVQPVIGKQIRRGVEWLDRRVAGDPASEMPVLDVQQRVILVRDIVLSAQPSFYDLAEGNFLCA